MMTRSIRVRVVALLACGALLGEAGCGNSSSASSNGGGGEGGGSGTRTYSCFMASEAQCTQESVAPGAVPGAQASCSAGEGTAGTGCPTENVAGCCKLSANAEVCYYSGDTTATNPITDDQQACTANMGTWTSSP